MPDILSRIANVASHVFTPQQARDRTEQPGWVVESKDGNIEIRKCPAMLVAETTCVGDREDAAEEGFKRLFNYIQGNDRHGDEIEMTSPVFHLPNYGPITEDMLDREDGQMTVRFMVPHGRSRESLPEPRDGAVKIAEIPARRLAALRFSGVADDTAIERHTRKLQDYLSRKNLTATGRIEFAIYDPPFTPPPSRRNEVLIPI